jgi:hypothetical protein
VWPSGRATSVRQPPWDTTEKGVYVDFYEAAPGVNR